MIFLLSGFVLKYLSASLTIMHANYHSSLIIMHAVCPTLPILLNFIALIMQRVSVIPFLSKAAVAVFELPSVLTHRHPVFSNVKQSHYRPGQAQRVPGN